MSDQQKGKELAQREMKYTTDYGEVKLTPALVKRYLVSGGGAVTDTEVVMFMQLCRYQGLNPWVREAYLIKYGDSPATLVVAKQAYDKRADEHEDFNGKESGVWVIGADGKSLQRQGSLVLPSETLVGGWCRVHRKSREIPYEVSVNLGEYLGRKKDGTVTQQWLRMPATMIVKVAEGQGERGAFPRKYMGLYEESEITAGAGIETTTTSVQAEIVTATPATVEEQPTEDPTALLRAQIQSMIDGLPSEQRTAFTNALKNMKSETVLRAFKAQIEALGKGKAEAEQPAPEQSSTDQDAGNGELDIY